MSQLVCAVTGCVLAIVMMAVGPANADQSLTKVVRDDRGGYIGARAIEIAELNARGIRVELRGRVCLSSCTMYLGAVRLCIDPDTSFGFHGPSRHGRPLPPDQFAHWSDVMARHYRGPLRTWFLDEARHELRGYKRISGAQLIGLGYPACP